ENILDRTMSVAHGDNLFRYGYIGNYDIKQLDHTWAYNYVYDQATKSYTYTGRQDLPVVFTPGDANPDAAIYTSWLAANSGEGLPNMNYIAGNNALRNGDYVPSIYELYN